MPGAEHAVTGRTHLVVLLGWPTGHSLSPVMHNAAFRHSGIDAVYVTLPVPPELFEDAIEVLRAAGALGANVTVPHKRAALERSDVLTDEARLVAAVNTLTWRDGRLVGDNTDAHGLRMALETETEVTAGDAAVVLGTGGAARAAAVACARLQLPLTVVGRRLTAAEDVVAVAEAADGRAHALDLADTRAVTASVRDARLVINATPLGLGGESLPQPFQELVADQIAYDLIYNPALTPFLRAAGRAGAAAHNGLGMLAWQAAAAYERWTDRVAPIEVMRDALDAAVRGTANAQPEG